jgi:eukaryotic-like serine/threonine-protein kinase
MNRRTAELSPWDNSLTEIDHSPSFLRDDGRRQAAPLPGVRAPDGRRRLGQYVMYQEIARGGMAAVHLGRSLEPGAPRAVAIKHLYRQLAWNPSLVAMFLDEGRLAARIRHPNVVAPLDFLVRVQEGELYLVMEYVHGETLAELLAQAARRERNPSASLAVGIMVGVLHGLQAAHDATTEDGTALEIVHRDVSPPNIMVGADGVARVLDFGVAKATVQDLPMDQQQLRGKRCYLAPEQIRNESVDRRADVYSAAIVLWEMLAGRRLFSQGDSPAAWDKILCSEIPPPSRFNPEVPRALDAAVLTAIARDRARRFPNARAFAKAIAIALRPASPPEIAAWVQAVVGDLLAERAARVSAMMSDGAAPPPDLVQRPPAPAPARRPWPRIVTRYRREAGAGLIAAVLGGLLWWSASATRPAGAQSAAAAMARPTTPPKTPPPVAGDEVSPVEVVPQIPEAAKVLVREAAAARAAAALEAGEGKALGSEDKTPRPGARAPEALPAPETKAEIPRLAAVPPEMPMAAVSPPRLAPTEVTPTEIAPAEAAPADDEPAAPAAHRGRLHGRAAVLARIGSLSDRGLEQYRRGNLDGARRLLSEALLQCSSAGFDHHPVKAITHARLGLVLVGGYKQPQLGVEQFRKALRIDPNVPLSRRDLKPEVTAAFREAVART